MRRDEASAESQHADLIQACADLRQADRHKEIDLLRQENIEFTFYIRGASVGIDVD